MAVPLNLEIVYLNFLPDVTSRLHINVIPYVVLLIIPTLGAMSDHSEHVRLMAAQCFATLISLMPLEVRCKLKVRPRNALGVCGGATSRRNPCQQIINLSYAL